MHASTTAGSIVYVEQERCDVHDAVR